MATRVYLPSSGSAPISPAVDAGWEITASGFARYAAVTTKISSAFASVGQQGVSNSDNNDNAFRQWILGPLAAQTISAQSITGAIRAVEDHVRCNQFVAWCIRAVSSDGGTVRGTLVAVTRDDNEIVPLASGLTSRDLLATSTEVTVSAGDYIVIELGTGGNPDTGSGGDSPDAVIEIGDASGGDLSYANGETNQYNPWIQFANDLTFASAGTEYDQDVSGALTSAGTAARLPNKAVAGAVTSGGLLRKLAMTNVGGALSSAGSVVKQMYESVAGALSSSGALQTVKTALVNLAGELTSAGAVVLQAAKSLAGSLPSGGLLRKLAMTSMSGAVTSAGAVVRSIGKLLDGALSSAGDLAAELATGAQTFYQSVSGTLTSAGVVVKQTAIQASGVVVSAGAVIKQTAISSAGTLLSSGIVQGVKRALISLAGTLGSGGMLSRSVGKTVSGALSSSGQVVKRIARSLAGVLSTVGSLMAALVGEDLRGQLTVSTSAVYVLSVSRETLYGMTRETASVNGLAVQVRRVGGNGG